jgi:hypothetical protein
MINPIPPEVSQFKVPTCVCALAGSGEKSAATTRIARIPKKHLIDEAMADSPVIDAALVNTQPIKQ